MQNRPLLSDLEHSVGTNDSAPLSLVSNHGGGQVSRSGSDSVTKNETGDDKAYTPPPPPPIPRALQRNSGNNNPNTLSVQTTSNTTAGAETNMIGESKSPYALSTSTAPPSHEEEERERLMGQQQQQQKNAFYTEENGSTGREKTGSNPTATGTTVTGGSPGSQRSRTSQRFSPKEGGGPSAAAAAAVKASSSICVEEEEYENCVYRKVGRPRWSFSEDRGKQKKSDPKQTTESSGSAQNEKRAKSNLPSSCDSKIKNANKSPLSEDAKVATPTVSGKGYHLEDVVMETFPLFESGEKVVGAQCSTAQSGGGTPGAAVNGPASNPNNSNNNSNRLGVQQPQYQQQRQHSSSSPSQSNGSPRDFYDSQQLSTSQGASGIVASAATFGLLRDTVHTLGSISPYKELLEARLSPGTGATAMGYPGMQGGHPAVDSTFSSTSRKVSATGSGYSKSAISDFDVQSQYSEASRRTSTKHQDEHILPPPVTAAPVTVPPLMAKVPSPNQPNPDSDYRSHTTNNNNNTATSHPVPPSTQKSIHTDATTTSTTTKTTTHDAVEASGRKGQSVQFALQDTGSNFTPPSSARDSLAASGTTLGLCNHLSARSNSTEQQNLLTCTDPLILQECICRNFTAEQLSLATAQTYIILRDYFSSPYAMKVSGSGSTSLITTPKGSHQKPHFQGSASFAGGANKGSGTYSAFQNSPIVSARKDGQQQQQQQQQQKAFCMGRRKSSLKSRFDMEVSLLSLQNAPSMVWTSKVQKDVADDGLKMINNYIIVEEIGRGSYGKVKHAFADGTNEERAIKIVKRPKTTAFSAVSLSEKLQREIAIMKKLRHKNVVTLYEVIDDPSSDKLYLVMEYVDRGTLLNMTDEGICTPLDVDVARGYMRQLLAGLQYLHRHDVVHRDIKPDNILLGSDGVVHLADFGVSSFIEGDDATLDNTEGTPAFLAPELCCKDSNMKVIGPPTDVWALGVTFYLMLFGSLPFQGHSFEEIRQAIMNDPVEIPEQGEEDVGSEVISLLTQMLEKDPTLRISVEDCRKHPCIRTRGVRARGNSNLSPTRPPTQKAEFTTTTTPSTTDTAPAEAKRRELQGDGGAPVFLSEADLQAALTVAMPSPEFAQPSATSNSILFFPNIGRQQRNTVATVAVDGSGSQPSSSRRHQGQGSPHSSNNGIVSFDVAPPRTGSETILSITSEDKKSGHTTTTTATSSEGDDGGGATRQGIGKRESTKIFLHGKKEDSSTGKDEDDEGKEEKGGRNVVGSSTGEGELRSFSGDVGSPIDFQATMKFASSGSSDRARRSTASGQTAHQPSSESHLSSPKRKQQQQQQNPTSGHPEDNTARSVGLLSTKPPLHQEDESDTQSPASRAFTERGNEGDVSSQETPPSIVRKRLNQHIEASQAL